MCFCHKTLKKSQVNGTSFLGGITELTVIRPPNVSSRPAFESTASIGVSVGGFYTMMYVLCRYNNVYLRKLFHNVPNAGICFEYYAYAMEINFF